MYVEHQNLGNSHVEKQVFLKTVLGINSQT